jgi:glycine cleavage system T protein (aminomethyltransferase)
MVDAVSETQAQDLARTPLHNLHLELGARMVPFAGYAMPLQYPAGIIKEHVHTRSQAGLFDVSHMGQIKLAGTHAALALESLVPADVVGLAPNRQRYALFTNEQGGILDDLMLTNCGDHLLLVVNAACKARDLMHLHRRIASRCTIEELADRALLALQGPRSSAVLARIASQVAAMRFMDSIEASLAGAPCRVSRSGYTGEDGYEISVPAEHAEKLARLLLQQPEVAPVGLGARDTLRLEAGLCLYGHDIDASTTPVEASLSWALSRARRKDGKRPGGYPGARIVARQLVEGVGRRRTGLRPAERVPVRDGASLVDAEGNAAGKVTSGSFGPSVSAPVAMGYVAAAHAVTGTTLSAMVRGKPVMVTVADLPFAPHRYFRG